MEPASVTVRAPDEPPTEFGPFLRRLQEDSGLPVTKFVKKIGISRAAFYLIVDNRQVPTLQTVAVALSALGFEDISVSPADDRHMDVAARSPDLEATRSGTVYTFTWPWSTADRLTARQKYAVTAGLGLGAAAGRLAGAALGGLVPAGSMGAMVAAYATQQARKRSGAQNQRGPRVRDRAELMTELLKVAEQLDPMELEGAVAALQELRTATQNASSERRDREQGR